MNIIDIDTFLNDLEDNSGSDDYSDVDNLFSKLETIMPPTDMVESIMEKVARLPLPVSYDYRDEEDAPESDTALENVI